MRKPVETDTIAAIATAPGEAGIGIVRISGALALEIGKRIYNSRDGKIISGFEPRRMYYGTVIDLQEKVLDEALFVYMMAPHSYTGEDVLEIQCHGGSVSVREILGLVLQLGARLADAGEFTKRAFLNGRIDLAQAEAVMDIISAKTGKSLNAAVDQLGGRISKALKEIMGLEIELIAHIEAGIDFPEHDIEELTEERIRKGLLDAKMRLEKLRSGFEEGRLIHDGVKTAIVGKPNVGKSSLLNALISESKAIVTDIPGTTRDIVEETLILDGILIRLLDTAGLRHTEDVVESIGVERTRKAIEDADLVLFVVDGSRKLSKEDEEILQLLEKKKVIMVVNKTDLPGVEENQSRFREMEMLELVEVSAKHEQGMEQLEAAFRKLIEEGKAEASGSVPVTNARHRALIDGAYEDIQKALEAFEGGVPLDLVSLDIRESWEKLGTVTGDSITGDVASEIFTRFCVGK